MLLLLCLGVTGVASPWATGAPPAPQPPAELSIRVGKNKTAPLLSLRKEGGILVLITVASTCPVTSLYWERLKGIWYNHRNHGVALCLVGGNADDSLERIQKILEERHLEVPIAWDEGHAVARAYGLKFTPEALILGKDGEVLYRGRIDDSWRDETRAQKRHLDAAITAALKGEKSPDQTEDGFMGSRLR